MRTSRKYSGPPVRRRGPWYKDVIERLKFERGVKEQFPLLRGVDIKGGYEYRITCPFPTTILGKFGSSSWVTPRSLQ